MKKSIGWVNMYGYEDGDTIISNSPYSSYNEAFEKRSKNPVGTIEGTYEVFIETDKSIKFKYVLSALAGIVLYTTIVVLVVI